jgi:GntR family transcriptional regulator
MVDQLREVLVDMLASDSYGAGQRIPSEQDLAIRFQASRATVREALKGLVLTNVLDCRHGKGYFVRSVDALIHKPLPQLQSVTELMADFGYTVDNRVLRVLEETPTPHVARQLLLDPGETILHLERVRLSRGKPLIYSIDMFPRALIPGPWQNQDWSGSLFTLFDQDLDVRVVSSSATISAAALSDELCAEIGTPAGTPWLLMEQLNMTKTGQPVIFSRDYHRGDTFQFFITRRRA